MLDKPGSSVTTPSSEEMIARTRALIPVLRERASQGERERRIAKETIADMKAAGLFHVLRPKRWGGYELDVPTCFEIQMALGEGDMSVAWIYGVVGLHPWLLALYDDRAAQDVWGEDPDALICSSLAQAGNATAVDGGFRLGGHWRYASGSDHCRWAYIGANVKMPDGTDDRRLFLVPQSDYELIDTWHVPGLKATGSKDLVIKQEVFVPAYRTVRLADNFRGYGPGQAVNPGPLFKLPFGQIFFRGISTGGIGCLKGMLDTFLEYATTRTTRALPTRASEDPMVHLLCAETAMAIDEMKAMIHRDFRAFEAYAAKGEMPPLPMRLRTKFYNGLVAERCLQLASRLFKASGSAGIFTEHPFGRMLTDITVARQHLSNQFESLGRVYGASLFGIDSNKDLVL